MRVAVTGANGFIGSALTQRLLQEGCYTVLALLRSAPSVAMDKVQCRIVGDLLPHTIWHDTLVGIDVLIHTAARVHIMRDTVADPLAAFRLVNVQGTLNLAQQAAAAGVRRFVFVSSIKVNGETTFPGRPFTADDPPAPEDAYAVSKQEAEEGLRVIAAQTGMEVVIVRPPLVYGPGVKANFEMMIRWVARGVPLPLGATQHNRRSFVALTNLTDLLMNCIYHAAAANQTFLISDGEDLSTVDLLCRIGRALGKPARLLPVPPRLLHWTASLLGKANVAQRLCGSLQVDIGKTRELLGWFPSVSVDEGIRQTVMRYLQRMPMTKTLSG